MDFESFWREYPRKNGRLKAERVWKKLRPWEHDKVMLGVKLWKQSVQWQSGEGMFVPYASTFLAQKRWAEEPWTGAFEGR